MIEALSEARGLLVFLRDAPIAQTYGAIETRELLEKWEDAVDLLLAFQSDGTDDALPELNARVVNPKRETRELLEKWMTTSENAILEVERIGDMTRRSKLPVLDRARLVETWNNATMAERRACVEGLERRSIDQIMDGARSDDDLTLKAGLIVELRQCRAALREARELLKNLTTGDRVQADRDDARELLDKWAAP